jgi:hypothetical protein
MAARYVRARALAGGLFLALIGWSAFLQNAAAQFAGNPQGQVQAHLAAGEFGPARNAALGVNDARMRDRLLGDIAAAQTHAGALQGSLATATDIGSDLARSGALQQMQNAAESRWFGRGGGVQADFDPLIDLITSTIEPDSWQEVGGAGSISGFQGGVRVDSLGLLRRIPPRTDAALESLRKSAGKVLSTTNPHKPSVLRKISLNRLERELQLRQAAGLPPDDTMKVLAGLQRIKYVLIYPETGDLVIAGPAGDWKQDFEGRRVDAEKARPVVQLDDLVVAFRNAYGEEGKFGCSINPTKPGLAAAQEVDARWAKKGGIRSSSQREDFLEELRAGLGQQDIVVYGIDSQTRAARVLVEADYRMKLIGMGLEEGTLGVTSYLKAIDPKRDDLNNLSVLRWWFTLNYDALRATEARDGFELRGPGVKVLSENEMLTAQGDRIHTGKSSNANSEFAASFTKQFEILAAKYPIYAELRNVFDLSLVAAVARSHNLPEKINWHLTHFGPDGTYEPELDFAPTKVDSVINHRIIDGKHLVAGVSGGVTVDARSLAATSAVKTDEYGLLKSERSASKPKELPRNAWWWD